MERIASLQNSKVKKWNALHQKKTRDAEKRFLIEGEHLIEEALKENIVETIVTDAETPVFSFDTTVIVTPEIMHKLSENVSSVHYIAVCHMLEKSIEKTERILMLDGVQDPGNLGTLIRTAVSFSFDGIYLSKECCDLYNSKVIRSTQGALFHMPVIREDILPIIEKLKGEGVRVIATSLHEALPMQDIKESASMAFVLGNEGQGVSEDVLNACEEKLFIEMNGFESLNVAVAGGIVMYRYRA